MSDEDIVGRLRSQWVDWPEEAKPLMHEVAEGADTDDGMVEVKWDEMTRLRDAIWAYSAFNRPETG